MKHLFLFAVLAGLGNLLGGRELTAAVPLGLANGVRAEVLSGLQAGQKIVLQ